MDTYQPIYDAVRSRISGGDIGQAIAEVARSSLDISFAVQACVHEFTASAWEHRRPSAVYRPDLSLDGDQWCALYGQDLQRGVAGFGDTPEDAMTEFDKMWTKAK